MPRAVSTPTTQVLSEGIITRAELKTLMRRSNRPAALRLVLWFLALAGTGYLVWMSMGTPWQLPAMFVHGVLLVHHFALQHECTHFTAFRTRWLNDVVAAICGFIIILPPRFFRYEHCDHHTHTHIEGRDPELIPLPSSLREYLWFIGSWPYWRAKAGELSRHALGRVSEADAKFVPQVEYKAVFWEARLMLAGYIGVGAVMLALNWWAPLWYWLLPVFLGEPVMRAIRLTEHVGRPTVANIRVNTRTNLVSVLWRFLGWNMNYHAEHHYAASVPFHALPRLHARLKGHLCCEERGYVGAHRSIIEQVMQHGRQADNPVRTG